MCSDVPLAAIGGTSSTTTTAVASPARREELCRIVIERVVILDRRLDSIVWTAPVRPFFEKQRVCPQGDSNP